MGQLVKISQKLKKYLCWKLKPKKFENLSKVTTNKQVSSLGLEIGTIVVVIDNHMVDIQIQIRKNTIEDVVLDGGSIINFIM